MARAEADPPEPDDGTEQRAAVRQPPVFTQHQQLLALGQQHATLRQLEKTAGFKLAVDGSYVRARVTLRAVDAYRQYYFPRPAGRIPAAIRQQRGNP